MENNEKVKSVLVAIPFLVVLESPGTASSGIKLAEYLLVAIPCTYILYIIVYSLVLGRRAGFWGQLRWSSLAEPEKSSFMIVVSLGSARLCVNCAQSIPCCAALFSGNKFHLELLFVVVISLITAGCRLLLDRVFCVSARV